MEDAHEPDIPELGADEAYAIAEKIVEMADRVRRISPVAPEAVATWAFETDDDRFSVTVKYVGKARSSTENE